MRTDSALHSEILQQAELSGDGGAAPMPVSVAVRDGVVTLSGDVCCFTHRVGVARAAERVHGVRSVVNEIMVRLPEKLQRTDADIAHDVGVALATDGDGDPSCGPIRARVHDRCVWLVGEAASHARRVAAERAVERVAGVKGITNLVTIKQRPLTPNIASMIVAALRRDERLRHSSIDIAVGDITVTLSGTVRSLAERVAAEDAVCSAGVTHVNNQLEVSV